MRVSDLDRLAVKEYLARIGPIETVRDLHDRRFPRPVLADDRVDRALLDTERNVVVGDDAAEGLCYVS